MIEQTYTIADIYWATLSGAIFGAAVFFEIGRLVQRADHRRWSRKLRGIE